MATLPAGIPIVNPNGTPTVQFLAYLTAVENGVPVIDSAALALLKPAAGWERFLSDIGKPVYGDGTAWFYADGTPAP